MSPGGNKNQSLYKKHEPRPLIPRRLEPADQHLKNKDVRSQQPLRTGCATIDLFLVCRAVLDLVEKRVVIAVDKNISSASRIRSCKPKYLSEVENIPLSNLTVESHAELISTIIPISYSGFSEIIHVQTSIPAAIAAGVKTSKGNSTRCLISS